MKTLDVIRCPGESYRQLVARTLREAGVSPGTAVKVRYRCSVEVAGGRGVAFVPYHTAVVRAG